MKKVMALVLGIYREDDQNEILDYLKERARILHVKTGSPDVFFLIITKSKRRLKHE